MFLTSSKFRLTPSDTKILKTDAHHTCLGVGLGHPPSSGSCPARGRGERRGRFTGGNIQTKFSRTSRMVARLKATRGTCLEKGEECWRQASAARRPRGGGVLATGVERGTQNERE